MKRYFLYVTLVVAIVINIFMLPLDVVSGKRMSGWGDYTHSTSEHDLPYNTMFRYLAEHVSFETLVVVGRTYPYPDSFYLRKYGLGNVSVFETDTLPLALPRGTVVMIPFVNTDVARLHDKQYAGLRVERVFEGWNTAIVLLKPLD